MTALRKHLSNENMRSPDSRLDPHWQRYQKQRIAHWNRVSRQKENPRRPGTVYHKLLQHYYRFFIPPGLRILEVGCCHGDLLASLNPSLGVGIDFSAEMLRCAAQKHRRLFFIRCDAHEIPIKEKFDVIILSDLVNDLWDVQHVLDRLQPLTHRRTRVVLNFYNNLWRMPLGLAKRMGLGANMLEQNWFSPHDVSNLLELSGYEIIHHRPVILLPLRIPFVSNLANRYLVNFAPLSWFALTHFVIARSNNIRESSVSQTPPSVSVIVPARNEAGNIEEIIERVPDLGCDTELVFVEGHSSDNTYETIQQIIESKPGGKCKLFRQTGKGKGDAVRLGFKEATGDIPWKMRPCGFLIWWATNFSAWHFHGCWVRRSKTHSVEQKFYGNLTMSCSPETVITSEILIRLGISIFYSEQLSLILKLSRCPSVIAPENMAIPISADGVMARCY
jgi:2-polyprenyl-3-methyl-5-hydroxy-6-metoxy-1,4-benzoquinol methylase